MFPPAGNAGLYENDTRSLEARKTWQKKKALKYERYAYSELGVDRWWLDCIIEMNEAH
jgi:hypothetical protein